MQQGGTALPANEHVLRIIWPFLPVVLALALFCLASVDMLSAARGFVAGESLWSKGQKDAVMHLLRYADARDPADFDAYRVAIAVPLGDRQARLELEKRPDFNRQVAVEGLLIGGNHHDDIPGMIRLYRYFRNVTEIDRAIAVWAAADVDIAHLTVVANHLRECVGTPAEPACLPPLQREIAELDARLGPMAMAFSAALGQASRRVRGVLLSGTVLLTILLLGCASWLSMRTQRKERQLRAALAKSEQRLQLAVAGSNDGLWDWHPHHGELYFSPRCAEMLGFGADELPHARETLLALMHPADVAEFDRQLARHVREGTPYDVEIRLRRKPGGYLWVRARGRMVRSPVGKAVRMAGSLSDISDRKRFEAQLFAEKERAQVTLRAIGEAVVTTDVWGRIDSMNPAAERLTGWSEAEAAGCFLAQVCPLLDESTSMPVTDLVPRALEDCWPSQSVMLLAGRAEEGPVVVKPSVALMRDKGGHAIGVVLVLHDVSMERAHAAQLAHEASHDALTGLVNRVEFERRVAAAIARVRQEGAAHTLMYLDLDQFKVVNDTCGHAAGDELIRQMAAVMRQQLRKGDTLARLGGDEFGVLLEHCEAGDGERVAEALRRAIATFRYAHRQRIFSLGVSIGLVRIDAGTGKVEEALSAADAACYMAKEGGRNRVQVYLPNDSVVRARHGEMEWVSRVHAALSAGRFCLYAQDIVPLQASEPGTAGSAGGAGRHIELLLRLVDEQGQLVPPMAFVPACERYNLMPMIDRWVVETAFAALARMHAEQPGEIGMCSINMSGASLADAHFPGFVRQQAVRHDIALSGICFEITETAAINNLAQAAAFIEQLQGMGCVFALDDFGAGMSSFAYLKHLPAAYLKIDGSFVREMLDDPVNAVMVEVIQRIGHAMGKKTIAEFVESEAMRERLRALGVDYAQGQLIGAPAPFARGNAVVVDGAERFAVTL